jgi:hypothetical protein
MNEEVDPFEAELLALRPLGVSPDLRRRVAERLAESPPGKPRRLWQVALAGGLAAACLAAAFYWWTSRRVEPEVVQPKPPLPVEAEDPPPSLQAYRLALARSPEELDALLDKQAVTTSETNPQLVQISAFTRSDATLHALLGDD